MLSFCNLFCEILVLILVLLSTYQTVLNMYAISRLYTQKMSVRVIVFIIILILLSTTIWRIALFCIIFQAFLPPNGIKFVTVCFLRSFLHFICSFDNKRKYKLPCFPNIVKLFYVPTVQSMILTYYIILLIQHNIIAMLYLV